MKPDFESIRGTFPKPVPVFPLAEVVLFPRAMLPLHIFEPRYRQMLNDALSSDRLIAMALLKQCDEKEYEGKPPFHETVCVGWIAHHQELDDGRSNVALLGVSAGRAQPAEIGKPYQTANVELLDDSFDAGTAYETKLERAYGHSFGDGADLKGMAEQLGEYVEPAQLEAALLNTCALAAPVFPLDKLGLLEERSVERRLDRLLELLERRWQWN